ncbi:MAG: glycosyltransferase family 39 protein, partial [Anaerolineae bacterium]|nr:glycosyltransferase family 39 protein [Anaerolineae bacterium]
MTVTRWSTRRWLLLILLGALLARLGFLALFGSTLSLQASGYDTYAVNVLSGHGYTRYDDRAADSDLPPLYVLVLIGIYTVLGRSALAVALVQTGCDLLIITLIYAIGRRVFPKRPAVALLGAAFTAFYPYLLFQDLSVNDTAIFVLLLAAGVWGAYRAGASDDVAVRTHAVSLQHTGPLRSVSWRSDFLWPAFVGLMFGLAALTKTVVVLVVPGLALWWWWRAGFRRAALATAVALAVLALVLLPWVIRNSTLHGALVLTSTNDGSNLHQGNNPCAADYLANGWDVQWIDCYPPMPDGLTELEESQWHREQALAWLAANPDQWLRLFGQKFLTLWNPQITPYRVPPPEALSGSALVDAAVYQYETPAFQLARTVHVLYFTPLLILGVLGWIAAAR